MKICSKCKKSKELTNFTKDSRAKDGLQRICRECMSNFYKQRSARYELESTMPERKVCNDCKQDLPSSSFYQSKKRSDGLYSYCKECSSIRTKASTFGLSVNATKIMLYSDSKCEICSNTDNLVIDHDHSCCPGKGSCGKCVRGILCINCNLAEGHIKNLDNAMKLVEYLLRNKK